MHVRVLVVLVLGALCVAHAAQVKDYDLSHVFNGDLASVLAGKQVDGASTPLRLGADGEVALLEESLAEPEMSLSVTGLAMSVTVPLGSPNIACKVAVDGRHYVNVDKHMLMGSVGVTFELSFLGLFKAHLTVKGSVFLFTTEHETLADILQDLSEFLLHSHHGELNREVARIFRELRAAAEDAHALTKSRLASGVHDMQEQAKLVDKRVRTAQAELSAGRWQDAMATLGMNELRDGHWPSMELPVEFKSPLMHEVLVPWQKEMKPLVEGMTGVLREHGMESTAADRLVDAEDETVRSGFASVFVTDIENLDPKADVDVPWNGKDDTPPDVFVRVTSVKADHTVRTRTVHDTVNPSFFEEVQVAVFNRDSASIKVEIVDADALKDDVLHTFYLPRTWLHRAGELQEHTINLGGTRRIGLVLRWLPMTRAHAWARIEPTKLEGVFALRKSGWLSDKVLFVRRAPGTSASRGWQWTARLNSPYWYPVRPDRLTQHHAIGLENRVVLAYLALARRAAPDGVEHARILMGQVLVSEMDFLADLVLEHAGMQVELVRAAFGAVNHVHMHWKAVGGTAEQVAFANRAAIRPLVRAADAALQRLIDLEESPVALSPYALRRKLVRMVDEMSRKVFNMLDSVEEAARYAELAAEGASTSSKRSMRIDLALIVSVGGDAATKGGGAKVTADLGGGWGVRGIIVAPDFVAPETHTVPFRTFVGSLSLTLGPVTTTGFALYKGFDDGSQGLYIFLDMTLPISAADSDAMKGPETALEWLGGRMNLVRTIQASMVAGVGEMDRSDVAQLATGVVLPQLRDALAGQLKKFPKLFTSVGATSTVTPGVSVRFAFSAKKGEELFAKPPSHYVLGYVMNKQTVSLAHVLGGAGAAAANALSVGAEGSVETGYYVSLSEVAEEAEHQLHGPMDHVVHHHH